MKPNNPAPSRTQLCCISLLAACCLAAASLPAAAQQDAPASAAASAPALPVPSDIKPVTLASDDLDIEDGAALRGLKRVALAGVAVYVVNEASAGGSAGAVYRDRTMASVNTSLKVVGLDAARLQALADAAHDRIVAALSARGLDVVPLAELKALPAYADLAAIGEPQPMALDARGGKGQVFSAHGLPLIHQSEQMWHNRTVGGLFGAKVDDRFAGLGDNLAAAMRKPKLDAALEGISKSSGGAAIVMARLVLTAAQVKGSGGAWALSASTSVRNSLFMPAWTNRLWVRRADGQAGRVSLKHALASEQALGEIVDVTSTGTKAANIALTAFTMLAAMSGTGRGVVASSQDLELRSSPELFEAVALPQIQGVVEGLSRALEP
jgi:hypothetical protein